MISNQSDFESKLFQIQVISNLSDLSGGLSLGIEILRDPDQKGTVGTLYPSALHTPKGFGLGQLMYGWDMGIFSNFVRFSTFLFWGYE